MLLLFFSFFIAEDVYLDRDDNFQVDVEELMVMEAIRLSLLESHTQGILLRLVLASA